MNSKHRRVDVCPPVIQSLMKQRPYWKSWIINTCSADRDGCLPIKKSKGKLITNTILISQNEISPITYTSQFYFRVKLARLEVFFKDTEEKITTSHREVMYDRTDILAYCGGILGLCMGVSILSFVEIIYHFTIRLCCNLVMRERF